MQFLKTLLVALTVGFAVAFAFNNWTMVPITLWGGLIAEINLPLLLLVTFLAGAVPMWLMFQTTRWRLKQRLTSHERALADIRAATPPAPVVADPEPLPTTDAPPLLSEARL